MNAIIDHQKQNLQTLGKRELSLEFESVLSTELLAKYVEVEVSWRDPKPRSLNSKGLHPMGRIVSLINHKLNREGYGTDKTDRECSQKAK
jgi:hypothetical protein